MEYIVPIGSDCSVALYLRDKGFRTVAFPFDWGVISIQTVIELFGNNFKGFLEKENLIFLPAASRKMVDDSEEDNSLVDDIITPCYCKRYHMLLPHDFSERGEVELNQVQHKYSHRITRLIQLLNDTNNTFTFVANNAPTAATGWRATQFQLASNKPFVNEWDDWKDKLSAVLTDIYPTLNFKLLTLKEFKKQ